MAKYDVTFVCGHTDTVQLYGANKERQSKIEYYGKCLCDACYAAKRAEDDAKRDAEAAAKAEAAGLPELNGSVKQVAWGNSIRNDLITKLAPPSSGITLTPDQLKQVECLTALRTNMQRETRAVWFIDNREVITTLRRCRTLEIWHATMQQILDSFGA